MGRDVDRIPSSGIIRIRDLMYAVPNPYRLDQGDVSFDAPDSVKAGVRLALDQNHTHYLPTTGVPRLRELLAAKLRTKNGVPVEGDDEVLVTNGGIHAVYIACQALLDPGDEVIVPDPAWPPTVGNIIAARGVPVACRLHESLGWRYELDELRAALTDRTRAIYLNSPNNPTGGMLCRADLETIMAIAHDRGLWVLSDEAYEDVLYGGAVHTSPASLPDAYARTLPIYTFSKTFAVTGLRLGYLAVRDEALRERVRTLLFYTTTNVSSLAQYGGIGGLEGSPAVIEGFRAELEARRDLFYARIAAMGPEVLSGVVPQGAFYAFLAIGPRLAALGHAHARATGATEPSTSWAVARYLIERARIGCVPGVDFGASGEGYIRFCFARERRELEGALDALARLVETGAA